jgi:sulfoacetaldehyde dehydrogenase
MVWGAGNAIVVIDETADLDHAAEQVAFSQMNDFAIGCSTENSMIVQAGVYDQALAAIDRAKGYVCSPQEKALLEQTLWVDGHLNPEVIVKSAKFIAEKAGFEIPEDRNWLVVEEDGFGKEHPFSGEKLSVVVSLYKYNQFEDAINLVNNIHDYSGAGHSCGIYTRDDDRIMEFAERTNTVRVAVGQATTRSNAGGWTSGMPFTVNLGCGTWGGNIASENVTWRNYINTTWIARPIEPVIPSDEELFGAVINEQQLFDGYVA